MLNKNIVIEEVTYNEALCCITKLLDQIASGLSSNNVLPVIKAFPEIFVDMLTYTGKVTPTDVLESINEDCSGDDDEMVVLDHFRRFVDEATEDGMLVYDIHIYNTCMAFVKYLGDW